MAVKGKHRGELSRNVAHQVKSLRLRRGWSVRQFGEECAKKAPWDVSWQALLTNIERGEYQRRKARYVTVDELFLLAEVLEVPVDFLVGRSPCTACDGVPPTGYTCNACGASTDHDASSKAAIAEVDVA